MILTKYCSRFVFLSNKTPCSTFMKHFSLVISLLLLFACKSQTVLVAPTSDVINEELDTLVVRASKTNRPVSVFNSEYKASASRTSDLIHTKLDLGFNIEKREVIGRATLDLRAYFYPVKTVELDAVNFEFTSVGMIKNGFFHRLDYDYDGQGLRVILDRPYPKEEQIQLQIDYIARPELDAKNQAYAIGSDQGLFFIDPEGTDPTKPTQIWTQGETRYNSRWFPTIDNPNERCTQELIVRVDNKYKTLSNGVLVHSVDNGDNTRTDHWKMDLPHAPYLFSLVVGEYAVYSESWRNKELSYYVYPEYAEEAKEIFARTPEMLDFFSEVTGVEYPWSKYSQIIVSDFVSGAMENTTAVTFSEGFLKSKEALVDYPNDMTVAHEMFHHWFGNLVTCESWANTALNEGFANYSEYLWVEHLSGETEADFYRETELNQYLNSSNYDTHDLIDFEHEDNDAMFDAHSYNKGGLILHMLRSYVGDEAFFAGIKKYLSDNAYASVEAHDLRLAFETIIGEDLNWFFDQWFFDKGHPVLNASYNYLEGEGKLEIVLDQVQDPEKHRNVFRFPLEYQLIFSDGRVETNELWVEERNNHYMIELSEMPEAILFNTNKDILCTIRLELTPEQEAIIFNSEVHSVFRYQAIQKLKYETEYKDLFRKALYDPSEKIRRTGLELIQTPISVDDMARISEMIHSEHSSFNRARALRLYLKESGETSSDFIVQIIEKEKSATVLAICLAWLKKNDLDLAIKYAEKFRQSKAVQIETAVADILEKTGNIGHLPYFKDRILTKSVFQLIPILNAYNKLLEKQSPAVIFEYSEWLSNSVRNMDLSEYKMRLFDQSIQYQLNALRRIDSDGTDITVDVKKYIRGLEKMLDY